jgi:hypothetical protein
MQTAHRLLDCTWRSIPNRDPVLDRLLKDGTFDHNGNTDAPNLFEEFVMGHSSVMANCLLMHIESLEAEVCVPCVETGTIPKGSVIGSNRPALWMTQLL